MSAVPATEELTHAELEDWIRLTGTARYDAYDLNPRDVFTAGEVRQSIADRLRDADSIES